MLYEDINMKLSISYLSCQLFFRGICGNLHALSHASPFENGPLAAEVSEFGKKVDRDVRRLVGMLASLQSVIGFYAPQIAYVKKIEEEFGDDMAIFFAYFGCVHNVFTYSFLSACWEVGHQNLCSADRILLKKEEEFVEDMAII